MTAPVSNCLRHVSNHQSETWFAVSPTVSSPYKGGDKETNPRRRLLAAIDRCCRLRGDTEENRLALRAECTALPAAAQADMAEHFAAEADAWAVATGQAGA